MYRKAAPLSSKQSNIRFEFVRVARPTRKGGAPLLAAALLWPGSAVAHGSDEVFYLLWWHIALLLWVLCFLIFGSVNKRRKLCSIAGFVLVPAVVWPVLGSISSDLTEWQDMALLVVVGAAPVLGFVAGLYLSRSVGRGI